MTSAAAALIRPSARMNSRGIGRPEIGKFCTARWVCAPHSASAGTCSSPMLSRSMRNCASCWLPGHRGSPGWCDLADAAGASRSRTARAWPQACRIRGSLAPPASPCPIESQLLALSPLDGRYAGKVDALRPIFSEYGLIKARVKVEVEWLLALADEPGIVELPPFSDAAAARLRALADDFVARRCARASRRSSAPPTTTSRRSSTSSRNACKDDAELGPALEFVHFACTSEDINNLATR